MHYTIIDWFINASVENFINYSFLCMHWKLVVHMASEWTRISRVLKVYYSWQKNCLELNMNEDEIWYIVCFFVSVFPTWRRKEMKTMSQKDGLRAVIPCPEVSFGEDYFYYSPDLSREAIFLKFFSPAPMNVFFIDNYFGSFKHHSSRFVLWWCSAEVLCAIRLVAKSLKHPRT